MFRLTVKETGRQQCLSPDGRQGKRLINCWNNRSVHFHCVLQTESIFTLPTGQGEGSGIQVKGYFQFYKLNAQIMILINTNK